jgi:hypothetical protein
MPRMTLPRALVTIPHFFDRQGIADARHDSADPDSAKRRADALSLVIWRLQELFGQPVLVARHSQQSSEQVSLPRRMQVDICVITNEDNHLVDQLTCPANLYKHVPAFGDPRWLGLAAHKVIAQMLGRYDWYCYLEDDTAIEDPLFFLKMRHAYDLLDAHVGPDALLQPARWESAWDGPNAALPGPRKLYPDYECAGSPYFEGPIIDVDMLGQRWMLEPARHPHAGCFFLDQRRAEIFTRSKYCGEAVETWITPPDTAATLAVMRTFRLYKPALESLDFLEVRHLRPAMIRQLRPMEGAYTWRKLRPS